MEIWLSAADGSNQRQLTSLDGPVPGNPRWSPDGRSVVFESRSSGNGDIWRISVDAGGGRATPERLTFDPANDLAPSYSSDGRWVYFSSNRGGNRQIWKMPASGGAPLQVTTRGGHTAVESPDGRHLYYAGGYGLTSLWRVPVSGGEAVPVAALLTSPANFVAPRHGLYYARWVDLRKTIAIEFLDFTTGKPRSLAVLDQWIEDMGLTVSADGSVILFGAEHRTGGDIMMVEDFR